MLELERIEAAIRASDGSAMRARWEFGRQVIAQRDHNNFLPQGLRKEICRRAGISDGELSNRTRFAEAYNETEVLNILSTSATWTAVLKGLPKVRKSSTPRPPKPRATPTAATVKEADRVEQLIAKPDVAAELLSRDNDTKATRKAQAAAERRDRDQARQQKEEDQQRQAVQRALRHRIVEGDRDWQTLAEQLQICADSVKRYLQVWDGLVIPNDLRLRTVDNQLSRLQQSLHELRGRLWPDYRAPGPILVEKAGRVIDIAEATER
jgi:hypothetical protein